MLLNYFSFSSLTVLFSQVRHTLDRWEDCQVKLQMIAKTKFRSLKSVFVGMLTEFSLKQTTKRNLLKSGIKTTSTIL